MIYVAKFEESIYVLHAFEKKSRKTKRGEIDLARQRLRQVVRDRARRKAGPGTGWTA